MSHDESADSPFCMTTSFVPLLVPGKPQQPIVETRPGLQHVAEKNTHRPTLELERDGEHVKRIRIHCACGETIVVDCVD